MTSFYELFKEYLFGRSKSKIVGIFILWLILFHIHIIFTALFVDQNLIFEKYGLLKGEYISEHVLALGSSKFWIYEILALLLSAGLTALAVWVLPKLLLNRAYSQELKDDHARKLSKLKYDRQLETKKMSVANAKIKTAQKVEVATKKQAEVKSIEEKKWDLDYSRFKTSKYFEVFSEIIEAIYSNGGDINIPDHYGNPSGSLAMRSDCLAYFDSMGIINILKKGQIELTNKGRFFVARYQIELSKK